MMFIWPMFLTARAMMASARHVTTDPAARGVPIAA